MRTILRGLALSFSGTGKVYLQTRTMNGMAEWAGPLLGRLRPSGATGHIPERADKRDGILEIDISERGAFTWALVKLSPGEQFVSESGAMFRSSSNLDIDVTTRSRQSGGLLAGVRRMLAQESFFFSTYASTDREECEVGLAPKMPGGIAEIECDGVSNWVCAGGS